jgi:sec-independent protein translocase protein TatC
MAHEEAEQAGGLMSFWGHVAELRNRLLVIAVALLAGFFLAWGFREEIFALLTAPIMAGLTRHGILRLTAIETTESMVVYLQLALLAAVGLTVPVTLHQLWLFVKPGLTPREIRPMRRIVVMSLFLFIAGLVFCYRLVLPLVMDFLAAFTLGSGNVDFQVTMHSAYSTASLFLIGFGLVFELPLVMVLLAATPLFDSQRYLRWTRYYIVVAFIIAAVLTPPDVLSQMLMGVPLVVLYFVGILLSWLMERTRARGREAVGTVDVPLIIGSLAGAGVCAALVVPWPSPPIASLPSGALSSVTWVYGEGTRPGCGALSSDLVMRSAAGHVATCLRYPDGDLLAARPAGEWDEVSGCPELPAWADCSQERGTLFVGTRLAVARLNRNLDAGLAEPGPHVPPEGAYFHRFQVLDSGRNRSATFVTLTALSGAYDLVQLGLTFQSPGQAEDFAALLAGANAASVPYSLSRAAEQARTSEAVRMLLDAVDALEKGGAGAAAKVAAARRLLDTAGSRPDLAECDTAACAWAALGPDLPAASEVSVSERTVNASFDLSADPVMRERVTTPKPGPQTEQQVGVPAARPADR